MVKIIAILTKILLFVVYWALGPVHPQKHRHLPLGKHFPAFQYTPVPQSGLQLPGIHWIGVIIIMIISTLSGSASVSSVILDFRSLRRYFTSAYQDSERLKRLACVLGHHDVHDMIHHRNFRLSVRTRYQKKYMHSLFVVTWTWVGGVFSVVLAVSPPSHDPFRHLGFRTYGVKWHALAQ